MDADDVPRWSPQAAVRKPDQFTAAPDFIDPYDSDHMPLWGRLGASWHGMAPRRQVMVAASMLVLAGAMAAFVAFSLADLGGTAGPSAGQGPVAAQDDGGLVQALPTSSGAAGNATDLPPLPTPSLTPS